MINLDSTILYILAGTLLFIFEIFVLNNIKEDSAVILVTLFLITLFTAVVFGYVVPLEEEEKETYYSDNIHEVIISSTSNISYYEKLIRIENVCRIYDTIPLQKCIGFAIEDIGGK